MFVPKVCNTTSVITNLTQFSYPNECQIIEVSLYPNIKKCQIIEAFWITGVGTYQIST